ncbi:hypothetical protein LTR62_006787 [Meristemomyces frigidus]|uniref:Transcription elongation factor SPT5 n=1 Tax=Meristemomyces frigidus TaxID=1508187 RepID=A0AAN7TG22_9PEZI|nr:hypothetical protein LTR62_006787 [Meristemomyces frigidus]
MSTANFLDADFPDEEEEDDFNPQAEVGSDEEAGEKAVAPKTSSRSRALENEGEVKDEDKADVAGDLDDGEDDAKGEDEPVAAEEDGEDDEEEEEEEDEEEDEEEEGQPSRKRRRKHRRNQFIDVEAEVDEEEDEEPEEDDDLPGDEIHPDDLQELPPGADRDDRIHRELDRQRDARAQIDAEQEAARLKERYGRQNRAAGAGSAIVPQRLLLPTQDDPRIWRMRCKPGKEKEVLISLQARIQERLKSREPVQILSAFERTKGPDDPMAGMLYVEARRVDDVSAALEGLTNMFMSFKPFQVPVDEMPDLLKVTKDKQLQEGMYVRVKRGLYAGDLGQVDEVNENGAQVLIRLVPRLDYGLHEDSNGPAQQQDLQQRGSDGKRKRPVKVQLPRPPPRLFSENDARKRHSRYISRQGGLTNSWNYQGKEYVDGYLVEPFRLNALQVLNVNPTLEEVSRFATKGDDGGENLDLRQLAATIKTSSGSEFLPGDKVEIFRGEQKGVSGVSLQVYANVVKIKVDPGHGSLSGSVIEAPVKELRKLFREGDHVKVIGGSSYQEEVGMVVRTKGDSVTLLTDAEQKEITVFSKDLREATDSGGAAIDSKYDLFDLVQLNAETVGIVVRVDRESLRVLDQNGSAKVLLPSNIANKLEKRRNAVATDRDGNELKTDDVVKEFSGEQKTGRVLHLYRNFLFAQNRERSDNAGVWAARHSNVVVVAAKGGKTQNAGPDLTKMNPAMKQNGGAMAAPPPPAFKGRDRLIGKTVKIRTGPNKGMIGIVKDASGEDAKVELHAKNKILACRKEMLALIDPNTGKVVDGGLHALGTGRLPPPSAGYGGGGLPSRTPAYGGGGRTPAYAMVASGGRTPAYASASAGGGGGRTPAWKQDAGAGGRTPAFPGGGQTAYGGTGFGGGTAYGGQTSYGGGGGQTSYGGATAWGGAGAWGATGGGRTPAPVPSGSKTPAYAGGLEAPTPGFNSAPTPGGYQDQPTPGGFRDTGYGRTPGHAGGNGFPETPGPYSAETPGAGGDDGPRYD